MKNLVETLKYSTNLQELDKTYKEYNERILNEIESICGYKYPKDVPNEKRKIYRDTQTNVRQKYNYTDISNLYYTKNMEYLGKSHPTNASGDNH
jgi:hypothetical protein